MVWHIKDKEYKLKKCFAIFPRRIDDSIVWLSPYYKTWDFIGGLYAFYMPHLFINKEDAEAWIMSKLK